MTRTEKKQQKFDRIRSEFHEPQGSTLADITTAIRNFNRRDLCAFLLRLEDQGDQSLRIFTLNLFAR